MHADLKTKVDMVLDFATQSLRSVVSSTPPQSSLFSAMDNKPNFIGSFLLICCAFQLALLSHFITYSIVFLVFTACLSYRVTACVSALGIGTPGRKVVSLEWLEERFLLKKDEWYPPMAWSELGRESRDLRGGAGEVRRQRRS